MRGAPRCPPGADVSACLPPSSLSTSSFALVRLFLQRLHSRHGSALHTTSSCLPEAIVGNNEGYSFGRLATDRPLQVSRRTTVSQYVRYHVPAIGRVDSTKAVLFTDGNHRQDDVRHVGFRRPYAAAQFSFWRGVMLLDLKAARLVHKQVFFRPFLGSRC